MPFPFEMKHYKGNKYIILSPVWYHQTSGSPNPSGTYFHICNLTKKQTLYSFEEQQSILSALDYKNAAAFLTNSHIGDVLFTDPNTLLYSPFVYNGTMLVFRKTDNGKWIYQSKVQGKKLRRPAFKPLYLHQDKRPQENNLQTGRNIIRFANQNGYSGGFLNSRSAGLFRLNKNRIVHFSVAEFKSKSDNSFYQKLYAELFDNDLNYLKSVMIKKATQGTLIQEVDAKRNGNHFFMVLVPSSLHSEVVKFSVEPPK